VWDAVALNLQSQSSQGQWSGSRSEVRFYSEEGGRWAGLLKREDVNLSLWMLFMVLGVWGVFFIL
jgi:hypothetical protein